MSLLLLILLTLACMPIDWPPPWFRVGPAGSAALTGGIVVALWLLARLFTGRTIAQLASAARQREAAIRAHNLRRFLFFFINLAGFGLALAVSGWGWTVRQALTIDDLYLPGAEVVVLAPYLLSLVGSWAIFFDAERAIHLTGVRHQQPFWTRGGYVLYLLRQHLLMVFTPVVLMIVQFGVLRLYPQLLDTLWAKLAAFLALFAFILILPSFVPLVLGLRPMPTGRLRERLEAAARRLGVRYRRLYIWDTRGNLATAMVTGLIPRFRQIVFTDLLLATLSDDEIEAVFGHEVGHVKHGHLFYYAVFLMLSFLTLGAVYRRVELSQLGAVLPSGNYLLISTVLLTGGYLFLVFGFISRRCERQADVFGCKAVSCPEVDCAWHGPETQLLAEGKGLCRTGVDTFVRALERVEEVNGMARSGTQSGGGGLFARLSSLLRLVGVCLATWQHSTINKRIGFLRTLADEPGRERRFQRRVTCLRWGLVLLLSAGVIVIAVWSGWRQLLDAA